MRLELFLQNLFKEGKVLVDRNLVIEEDELKLALRTLAEHEAVIFLNYPPNMPAFDENEAAKAIAVLYNICQFVVNRDFSNELIENHLNINEIFQKSACRLSIRSVDSIFSYLPDLFKIAKRLSEGDLLCEKIKQLAAIYPLSSPGIPLENVDDSPLLQIAAFKVLYLNRIIKYQAKDRLKNPAVLQALKDEMGLHLDLCNDLIMSYSEEIKI